MLRPLKLRLRSSSHLLCPFDPPQFAEIGYASWRNASTDAPGCCEGPADFATQSILYQSFFNAVYTQPFFKGVFFWSWDATLATPQPCSTDFNVLGKPAQAVVRAAFSGGGGSSRSLSAALPIPMLVYSNGALRSSFSNWSWGARVDLASAADPYPAHAASCAVEITAGYGALAFAAPAPLPLAALGYTRLEFDLRADGSDAAYALRAYLCPCSDCGSRAPGCAALPAVASAAYAAAPCSLPVAWDGAAARAARFSVPLGDLGLAGGAAAPSAMRLQIGSDAGGVAFAVDNVAFV